MTRWRLLIQPQAERDLHAIGERLEEAAGAVVAGRWNARFQGAIRNLGDNPYLGTESDLLGKGRRRLVVRPYLIVYRIEGSDTVRIIRVVDSRRDLPRLFRDQAD